VPVGWSRWGSILLMFFIFLVKQVVQFIFFFFPLASDVCCMGAQSLIIGVLQVQNGTLSLRIMAGLDFINE
jgi:hypothetical protein